MKPEIPNIIFKSLLWLKQNNYEYESKYLLGCYTLTLEQKRIYDMINKKDGFGTVEGKAEGQHG